MLVGRVVDDKVHDQPHPTRMHGGQQCVEVLEGSERRVDVLVVADVVAGVVLRRRVDRAQPQHVHAEIGQVIEPVRHAGKVADPVTVGIGKTARMIW